MRDIIETVREELQSLSYQELLWVADETGLCVSTLYDWRSYRTMSPLTGNVLAVAEALGYEVSIDLAVPEAASVPGAAPLFVVGGVGDNNG